MGITISQTRKNNARNFRGIFSPCYFASFELLKFSSFHSFYSSLLIYFSQLYFFSGTNSMTVQSRNQMRKLRSKGISEKRTVKAPRMRTCSPILGKTNLVDFIFKNFLLFVVILTNISNFIFQTKSAAIFHPTRFPKL